MQLEYIFIHPRVYEFSRVREVCTSCFSSEVLLHHNNIIYKHACTCRINNVWSLIWDTQHTDMFIQSNLTHNIKWVFKEYTCWSL